MRFSISLGIYNIVCEFLNYNGSWLKIESYCKSQNDPPSSVFTKFENKSTVVRDPLSVNAGSFEGSNFVSESWIVETLHVWRDCCTILGEMKLGDE